MSKKRFAQEEKYEIILAYYNGEYSIAEIEERYRVNRKTVADWRRKYEKFGLEGLNKSKGWKGYSKDVKRSAVEDYLSGNFSLREVVLKYGISSNSVFLNWIKIYNGHRELKTTTKGMSQSMTRGKATTMEERIEIARDCLEHGKDYKRSMKIYKVSYQQVYHWVKKYEEGGAEALQDKRGKRKIEEELSPEQKIQREMKKLAQENELLRAENALLKKLEEIERGRLYPRSGMKKDI